MKVSRVAAEYIVASDNNKDKIIDKDDAKVLEKKADNLPTSDKAAIRSIIAAGKSGGTYSLEITDSSESDKVLTKTGEHAKIKVENSGKGESRSTTEARFAGKPDTGWYKYGIETTKDTSGKTVKAEISCSRKNSLEIAASVCDYMDEKRLKSYFNDKYPTVNSLKEKGLLPSEVCIGKDKAGNNIIKKFADNEEGRKEFINFSVDKLARLHAKNVLDTLGAEVPSDIDTISLPNLQGYCLEKAKGNCKLVETGFSLERKMIDNKEVFVVVTNSSEKPEIMKPPRLNFKDYNETIFLIDRSSSMTPEIKKLTTTLAPFTKNSNSTYKVGTFTDFDLKEEGVFWMAPGDLVRKPNLPAEKIPVIGNDKILTALHRIPPVGSRTKARESGIVAAVDTLNKLPAVPAGEKKQIVIYTDESDSKPEGLLELQRLAKLKGYDVKLLYSTNSDNFGIIELSKLSEDDIKTITSKSGGFRNAKNTGNHRNEENGAAMDHVPNTLDWYAVAKKYGFTGSMNEISQ